MVIKELVNNILEDLAYMEKREKIKITNKVTDEQVISTDEGRLKIILSNLIGNAIKYHNTSKPDPWISIDVEFVGNMVNISVEDNGPGIKEELTDQIFEMFYRASEQSDGSGLGLYIAREMAENLQGTLTVKSKVDFGTTFTLTIPVMEPSE